MNELMPPHAFFSSFFPFMSCLTRNILGVAASKFGLFLLNPQVALPLPDHFFFHTHPSSLPLAPSLPPTLVGLRNYNNGPIAFSFASNSALARSFFLS